MYACIYVSMVSDLDLIHTCVHVCMHVYMYNGFGSRFDTHLCACMYACIYVSMVSDLDLFFSIAMRECFSTDCMNAYPSL